MSQNEPHLVNDSSAQTEIRKARAEGRKLQFDLYKHLTTLSTGSILLFVSFLEKLFVNPEWKFLVAVALGAFVLSILASIGLMMSISGLVLNLERTEGYEKQIVNTFRLGFIGSGGGFVLGIVCLAVFALKNLYK